MIKEKREVLRELSLSTKFYLKVVLSIVMVVGLEWIFKFNFFSKIASHSFFMAPTTVIIFIFSISAFYMRASWQDKKTAKIASTILLLTIAMYCCLVLIDDFIGLKWNLGHLGIEYWRMAGRTPQELSPLTAIIFLLFVTSFFFRESSLASERLTRGLASLQLLAITCCWLTFHTYKFNIYLGTHFNIIPMTLTTALAFIFLWSAYISQYEKNIYPLNYIWGDTIQALLVRIILLIILINDTFEFLIPQVLPFISLSTIAVFLIFLNLTIILALDYLLSKKMAANYLQSNAKLALLATIVKNAEDAFITTDLNNTITSWNRGAERLFGYTDLEAIGQNCVSLLNSPDQLSDEHEVLLRLKNGEHIKNIETTRLSKDQRRIDVSLSSTPVTDQDEKVVGISVIARRLCPVNCTAIMSYRDFCLKTLGLPPIQVGERPNLRILLRPYG